MLMLDRYLIASGNALDLATGMPIRWHVRSLHSTSPLLFTVRGKSWLIDFDRRKKSRVEVWERAPAAQVECDNDLLQSFRSALADARDGHPRAFDVIESSADKLALLQRLMAREARLSGFVPMAADALGAVLSEARWRWPSWLKERSLVIFATDARLSPDATLALFHLATKDSRPHLIVRCSTSELWRPRLVAASLHLQESRPGETLQTKGPLVERAAELRDAGQFVDAEAAARWSLLLGSDENSPSGQCALARSLIGQRRLFEARAALADVDSAEAHDLRGRIQQQVTEPAAEPVMVDALVNMLRSCQDLDDPGAALSKVAAQLRASLAATVVAFVIADRQRPHVVAHAGAFSPPAALLASALQTLDTGICCPLHRKGASHEAAWPVRYGSAVIGAVWVHWSMGAPLVAADVSTLMGLAAAATAPAVYQHREQLHPPAPSAAAIPELVGDSTAMERVRQAVLKAAASPFPVLIEGESGVGKELVARAVHAASVRRGRRFSALNCAALADDLVEAELFGHTRGAFTGAVAERMGLFEESEGGTLLLDEVAELSPRVQAKLLRTLQEGEVRRLGESMNRRVDARIVAATNRPLNTEVSAGRFRNDLRYRLDVLRISIPPLRERLEDLPPLVRHIWSELARRTGSRAVLSPSALSMFGAYDWPGNVRELQNVLASVMVAAPQRGVVGPGGLPAHITRTTAVSTRATLADARREFELRFVRAALARSGGRTVAAARELGVSRQGLRKLTARLGLANVDEGASNAH